MTLGRVGNARGAGGIGCILLALLVAAGIFAGKEYYLPKFRNTSFEERLTEIYPYFNRQTETVIRNRIIETAADFDIALTPAQVKLGISADRLTIDITYEKFIDLKVWQTTEKFFIHRNGPY